MATRRARGGNGDTERGILLTVPGVEYCFTRNDDKNKYKDENKMAISWTRTD